MRPSLRRVFSGLALVGATVVVASLAPSGCRLVRAAEAATQSTSDFLVDPSDPRVAYEPGAERMANVVAAAMPASIRTVEERQLGPFELPIRVYVCATIASFARFAASPRAGGHTLAHRVFLSPKPENTDERVPRVLTHELSHLHLGQKRGLSLYASLPVWFVEGLAVEVSGGGGAEGVRDDDARRAIAEGHAFAPETEGSFLHPKAAGAYGLDAHMFYAQAGMFIGYLRARDAKAFASLVHAVEAGEGLGPSFEAAYGLTMEAAFLQFVSDAKAKLAAGP